MEKYVIENNFGETIHVKFSYIDAISDYSYRQANLDISPPETKYPLLLEPDFFELCGIFDISLINEEGEPPIENPPTFKELLARFYSEQPISIFYDLPRRTVITKVEYGGEFELMDGDFLVLFELFETMWTRVLSGKYKIKNILKQLMITNDNDEELFNISMLGNFPLSEYRYAKDIYVYTLEITD